ncbi:hypothetical protein F4778DRAFT_616189 [Xylariomycetidae sp. FL2044]|nr:hypothetical protein F4778DRAFT_616189 [Xylariomycetidae sp. FL2044]
MDFHQSTPQTATLPASVKLATKADLLFALDPILDEIGFKAVHYPNPPGDIKKQSINKQAFDVIQRWIDWHGGSVFSLSLSPDSALYWTQYITYYLYHSMKANLVGKYLNVYTQAAEVPLSKNPGKRVEQAFGLIVKLMQEILHVLPEGPLKHGERIARYIEKMVNPKIKFPERVENTVNAIAWLIKEPATPFVFYLDGGVELLKSCNMADDLVNVLTGPDQANKVWLTCENFWLAKSLYQERFDTQDPSLGLVKFNLTTTVAKMTVRVDKLKFRTPQKEPRRLVFDAYPSFSGRFGRNLEHLGGNGRHFH